jgi:hypothetical protein
VTNLTNQTLVLTVTSGTTPDNYSGTLTMNNTGPYLLDIAYNPGDPVASQFSLQITNVNGVFVPVYLVNGVIVHSIPPLTLGVNSAQQGYNYTNFTNALRALTTDNLQKLPNPLSQSPLSLPPLMAQVPWFDLTFTPPTIPGGQGTYSLAPHQT